MVWTTQRAAWTSTPTHTVMQGQATAMPVGRKMDRSDAPLRAAGWHEPPTASAATAFGGVQVRSRHNDGPSESSIQKTALAVRSPSHCECKRVRQRALPGADTSYSATPALRIHEGCSTLGPRTIMSNHNIDRTDLVHLVQHVALNQSGWWEQAMERLILACAYTGGPCSQDDICEAVRASSGVEVTSERLTRSIASLLDIGALVQLDGNIRVSEAVRTDLGLHEEQTLVSETRVRKKFADLAETHELADSIDELWDTLETQIILPIVRHFGARLYALLTSGNDDARNDLASHVGDFLEETDEQLREFYYDFIDPSDDDIRRFVLRRLNAQYVVDAAALSEEALDKLARQDALPSRIRILLDTNFLFSVMGLHDNPGNEEADKLLQLIEQVSSRVTLQLYVLPITIDEARRVLRNIIFKLTQFRGQPNLAEAAQLTHSLGLAGRYFDAARRSAVRLSAEDFFGPYESDLLSVLRNKSVELYNANLDQLRTDQHVIDDIHDQTEFQQLHRTRGEKPYETNLHDMVLWHFAHRERRSTLTSPLEATIWVVTLDYSLLSFDRFKRKSDRRRPPICLEPAAIIQLFQFWVPSSTELDEALVGSIRQPLLLLDFDIESEQITLRILDQLSRFDGAEDLPPDVAVEILTNQALRERISKTHAEDARDETVVGQQLLAMIKAMRNQRDQAKSAARDHEERERSVRKGANRDLEIERSLRTQSEDQISIMQTRISELERLKVDFIRKAESRHIAWRVMLSSVIALVTLAGTRIALEFAIGGWLAWVSASMMGLLVYCVSIEVTLRNTRVADSRTYGLVVRLRKWWIGFVGAVIASLIAGLISQG